jgi:hypothetical protein
MIELVWAEIKYVAKEKQNIHNDRNEETGE